MTFYPRDRPDLEMCRHSVQVHQLLNDIVNLSADLLGDLGLFWEWQVEEGPDELSVQYGARWVDVKFLARL